MRHIDDRVHRPTRGHSAYQNEKVKSHGLPQVLIADDDHEAAHLLQIVLMNFGFETTLVFDGKEAFKKITQKPFDLVFLDIHMPGLTGLEVLAKIEEERQKNLKHIYSRRDLPVITYSSFDQGELNLPSENGFYIIGHWQKPITLPELTVLTGKTIARLHIPTPTKESR